MKHPIRTPREALIGDVFTCAVVALCVLSLFVAVLYNTDWWPL